VCDALPAVQHASILFISSRRRHTRCYRDWSSDVCSSDLVPGLFSSNNSTLEVCLSVAWFITIGLHLLLKALITIEASRRLSDDQIGRASCRERGCVVVGATAGYR